MVAVSDTGDGFDLSAVQAGHGLDSLVGRLDALFSPRRTWPCCVARVAASWRWCCRDHGLRAYLVDDEPLAIARLTRLLGETGRVEVIGSATDPEEAVEALTAMRPDVCFLDIQMPRLNGFEMLARLPVQPIVVFTTAHDRYALQAFAANSVDYLLKPVDPRQLDRALGRMERLRSRSRCRGRTCRGCSRAWPIRGGTPGPSIPSGSRHAWGIDSGSSTCAA